MLINKPIWHLRNFELFHLLPEADVEHLESLMQHRPMRKGEPVYSEGEEVDKIYFLKEGRIKILQSSDEDSVQTITELLQDGDFFGKLSLQEFSSNESAQTAVIASEHAIVCSLATAVIEEQMKTMPQLAINYAGMLAERLRQVEHKLALFLRKDIRTRLISFLAMHAQYEGRQQHGQVVIEGFLTHQDIANFIGTSRQTVTTLLNELANENLLKIAGKKITIASLAALKKA